jgi:4a-hydroxytetrahydrobiopterin dehydratase
MFTENDNQLQAEFKFKNFAEALDFVNKIGELAEEANHHPDIAFGWGYVKVSLTTHDQGAIVTKKDRELAGKINDVYQEN